MNSEPAARALLMSAEYNDGLSGFHRLTFKVDQGRGRMLTSVTVLISVDAHRKLATQLARARLPRVDRERLLKLWARWEIGTRLQDYGVLPATLTITASDLDDLGAYAHGVSRALLGKLRCCLYLRIPRR